MKLETFFEKFELFAGAPDAVGRMRELVLDLAVAGRLLAPSDRWETRALKSLATKIGSGATPSGGRESYVSSGIPLIRSMNVHFRGFDRSGLAFLTDEQADGLSNVAVEPDDVLLNITGASIGRVTTAPSDMAGARVNQHVTIIRPTSDLLSRFLAMFLASPSVQRMIDEIQVGATRQALTKGMIEEFAIPLPPLAEQKRIVAKVDELMALCDRLEAQQQERQTRHTALARASLARFADAPTPANLDFLFHKSYAIPPAELRKAILTLAVQGKLSNVSAATVEEQTAELNEVTDSSYPISYGVLKPGAHDPKGVRLVKSQHIRDWKVAETIEERITAALDAEFKRTKIKGGEILLNLVGASIGRCAIAPQSLAGANVSRAVAVITLKPEHDAKFVLILLTAVLTRERIALLSSGTAQPVLNLGVIRKIRVWLPPLAVQRQIVATVDQLMALVDGLETQLTASRSAAEKLTAAIVAELTQVA